MCIYIPCCGRAVCLDLLNEYYCYYYYSFDKVCRLTTFRHIAVIPRCTIVRGVAPWSSVIVAVWVTTVVARADYASISIHAIVSEAMLVWRLRCPGLALLSKSCYRCVTKVLASIRRRVAETCTSATQISHVGPVFPQQINLLLI